MGKRGQRVDGLQVNLTDGLMSLGLAASASASHVRYRGFETCLVTAKRDQQHMEKILLSRRVTFGWDHTVLQFDPLQKI